MKSLTKPELDSLLSVARKYNESDYLLLLTMFNHGLRVSETINLTRANIVDGFLAIQRLKGSRRTTQPLLANERAGLEALASTEGRFFPISRWTVNRRIEEYGREAGIPEHKLSAHKVKHTCGRLAYEAGIGLPDIQCYLGHVSGKNTMVYMESTEEQAANAFAAVVGK